MASNPSPFSFFPGTLKCTLFVTQQCNLACDYCYIDKKKTVMPLPTAEKIMEFVFAHAAKDENIEIGFFGGEPLLEFDRIKEITDMIHRHKSFDAKRVNISIVTNGTIFSEEIAEFLKEKKIVLCVSCDGPAAVQDVHRHFPNGAGSSALVEKNLREALKWFPLIPVNAVYSPENIASLPAIVDYLVSLGVVNIYLNPNISARWTQKEADLLPAIYGEIGKKYVDFYLQGNPKYISLIDSKIAVILRRGYQPLERCRMGQGEFAFAPSGNIYPCERLVGGDDGKHCMGNINQPDSFAVKCGSISCAAKNPACKECGLAEYCMNWCGCTNFHTTGSYNVVGPFVCASEKAAIQTAFDVLQLLKDKPELFSHHLAGTPLANVMAEAMNTENRHLHSEECACKNNH